MISVFVDNIFILTLAPLNFLASGFIFSSRALLHIIPQVPQVKTVEDFSATTFFLFSALFFDFLSEHYAFRVDIFRAIFLDIHF